MTKKILFIKTYIYYTKKINKFGIGCTYKLVIY